MVSSMASVSEGMYCGSSWECAGGDSVVGSELEAAEALAGLAHSGLPTHRVKTESPPPHSGGTNPQEDAALLRPPCPSEDQAGVVKQQGAVICTLKMEGMDVEQDAEFHKPSHISNSSYVSCSGSKSRPQLTEAEKEARRLRRVLANRESARQTIRRRQIYEGDEFAKFVFVFDIRVEDLAPSPPSYASLHKHASSMHNVGRRRKLCSEGFHRLHSGLSLNLRSGDRFIIGTTVCFVKALFEELTRKAVGLASENENLKREKEVALEEYDSLKSTNKRLKAQMAETVETGVEETRVDSKPANVEIPTSLYANCPYLVFSQPPFSPFPWPPIIPSSNPVQLNSLSQNAIFVPSEVPMPSIAKPDVCHEPENPMKVNGQGTPFYIVPYPWFFPIPDHGDGLNLGPSIDLNNEQTGNSNDNPCSASPSSNIIVHEEKNPVKAKPEASSKKDDGAAEAAEARRKRKELIKLKRLHCRYSNMGSTGYEPTVFCKPKRYGQMPGICMIMAELSTMKFDGSCGVQEHILNMYDKAAMLATLGIQVDESFLIQAILNSLQPQFGPFKLHCNAHEKEWSLNELTNLCVHEEVGLRKERHHTAFVVTQVAMKEKGKVRKYSPMKVDEPEKSSQAHNGLTVKGHFCG
ncbi:hypothetical protein RHSIM_Rhsim03G0078100 [Rhododendron simsii]|uniref:BZIP domain-containing protein n=1 Tax=Rhododendron simsii TaxID=118357 RepID=A0A834H288_RHOSS|nr:hypothetical protein RHSIM_Rhsim03G0078100 [Rhododendron simsii]